MARLECSRATLYRIVQSMKDYLNAPIEFDSDRGGFIYKRVPGEESYELPGLWFSPAELQSLAVMQRILRDLGGGLLAEQVSAITKHLNQLVQHRRLNLGEAAARIRFPGVASRTAGEAFQVAASATLQRRKLWFEYHSRGTNRAHGLSAAAHALSRGLVSRCVGRGEQRATDVLTRSPAPCEGTGGRCARPARCRSR
jgi:proteasome accessory factor C